MDKNKTEKDKLYQWACEYATKDKTETIFSTVIKDSGSYYEKVENREYIREYEPDTAVDVRQELSTLWGKDRYSGEGFEKIKKVCLVACMKNKNRTVYDEQPIQDKDKKQLKPYIYQM